jgi:NADH-quinone oxidoreductase subunit J
MTSKPRLATDANFLQGVGAALLFLVMGYVFVIAPFGNPAGFADGSITATIGYSLLDLTDLAAHETEGFLVAFIVIAVVLDAALDGSVMLARREDEEGTIVTALTDGGRRIGGRVSENTDDGGED